MGLLLKRNPYMVFKKLFNSELSVEELTKYQILAFDHATEKLLRYQSEDKYIPTMQAFVGRVYAPTPAFGDYVKTWIADHS
jgi:hypothetical protein